MMQQTERRQCNYPGCSSAVYVTVMEHGTSKAEKLCLAHPAHESTSYVDKGRALFEKEFDSFQYLGGVASFFRRPRRRGGGR